MNRGAKLVLSVVIGFVLMILSVVTSYVATQFGSADVGFVVLLELTTLGFNAFLIMALWSFYGHDKPLLEVVHATLDKLTTRPVRVLTLGLAGFIVGMFGEYATYAYLPIPESNNPANNIAEGLNGVAFAIFALGAIIVAPICEEIIFRGFAFNMVRSGIRRLSPSPAMQVAANGFGVLVSAFLFAIAHGSWTAFPGLFVFGIVIADLYRRTDNLYAAIAMHMINNSWAVFAIAVL